jgi:hypothetical protein
MSRLCNNSDGKFIHTPIFAREVFPYRTSKNRAKIALFKLKENFGFFLLERIERIDLKELKGLERIERT